jgi:hypothetical protein
MNVHVLSLMYRKKDNPESQKEEYCFREVYSVGDIAMREEKILKLQAISKISKGKWRIYESINERDTEKAKRLLFHRMLDGLVNIEKIDSEWKSILQKHECRGSRKFLLDLDNCDNADFERVLSYLERQNVEVLERYESVNGFHVITDKFDCRELRDLFKFVDVKTDDMRLVMSFEE